MTAEVAIINRSGVALAADSALTVGQERVWTHANKIFSLSPHNDIGIMIYGSGAYVGFPWEILIKLYRKRNGTKKFNKVEDCQADFFTFISGPEWRDEYSEDIGVSFIILQQIESIKKCLDYTTAMEFRQQVIEQANWRRKYLDTRKVAIPSWTKSAFEKEFGSKISNFAKDILGKPITVAVRKALISFLHVFFVRERCLSGFETGIVFCGYGDSELFPVVIHTVVDGRIGKHLRAWVEDTSDFNIDRSKRGEITPFAQTDMAELFLEGVSAAHKKYISRVMEQILDKKTDEIIQNYVLDDDEKIVEKALQSKDNKKLVEAFKEEFSEYRDTTVIQPIMEVVAALPREEMAAMAEALVELTSLRRKVDSRVASVSGPVDVAVISKGDGFIWIKRKHYFDLDKNTEFAYRKHRGMEDA